MSDIVTADGKTAAVENDSGDYVNALVRGLEVIRAFSRTNSRMTLSEVAAETGLTRAAARRFLLTLVREGYAGKDGKFFMLTPKVLELGFSVLASMDITDVIQPIINELAEEVRESVFVTTFDQDSVIYIARAASQRVVSVGIAIGSRGPAHCLSTGRVLLAALPETDLENYFRTVKPVQFTDKTITSRVKLRDAIKQVKSQGWSIVDEEYEIGLRSISVPVRDRSGRTIAALNICCPSSRWTVEDMRSKILLKLIETAQTISNGILH